MPQERILFGIMYESLHLLYILSLSVPRTMISMGLPRNNQYGNRWQRNFVHTSMTLDTKHCRASTVVYHYHTEGNYVCANHEQLIGLELFAAKVCIYESRTRRAYTHLHTKVSLISIT